MRYAITFQKALRCFKTIH